MNKYVIFNNIFLPLSDTFLLRLSKFFLHIMHILQTGKPEHGPCLSSQCNALAGLQTCRAGGPESKPVALTAKPHFIPRRLYMKLIHFLRARFCPFTQSWVIRCSASRHTVPGHQLPEVAVFNGAFPNNIISASGGTSWVSSLQLKEEDPLLIELCGCIWNSLPGAWKFWSTKFPPPGI